MKKARTKVRPYFICAQERTRTSNPLLGLPPQGSASTNFATCADQLIIGIFWKFTIPSLSQGLLVSFANGINFCYIQGHGGRSSMVEPWFVVPVVVGSSPIDHPDEIQYCHRSRCSDSGYRGCVVPRLYFCAALKNAPTGAFFDRITFPCAESPSRRRSSLESWRYADCPRTSPQSRQPTRLA
jgi:hypothetical protein